MGHSCSQLTEPLSSPLSEQSNSVQELNSSHLATSYPNSINNQPATSYPNNINTEAQPVNISRRRLYENAIVIWLDSTINQSDENYRHSISQLRRVVDWIEPFTDIDSYSDFLKKIKDEKIFLIVSDSLGEKVVPRSDEFTQLIAIYVFCDKISKHEEWIRQYSKIKGIFTQIEPLCQKLRQDVRQSNNNITPISIVPRSSESDSNKIDSMFECSQLLKETLVTLNYNEKAKMNFINVCRLQYSEDTKELQEIQEFERKYAAHTAIWWYTRNCFIYSMLNEALRTLKVEIITAMGFFVRDLHQQIHQLHAASDNHSSFIVYRGQGMFDVDFKQMTKNEGGLISFNKFLSASTDKSAALNFARPAQNTNNMAAILFCMEINPSLSSFSFASVDKISCYPKENEILFSMNTVFRIGKMEMIEERLWEVNLILIEVNDQQFKSLTDHLRKNIDGATALDRLIALMHKMGEPEKAKEISDLLLKTTSKTSTKH